MNVKNCFGQGRRDVEVCEVCDHKDLCEVVKENFVSKEDVKRALGRISEIEGILHGEK